MTPPIYPIPADISSMVDTGKPMKTRGCIDSKFVFHMAIDIIGKLACLVVLLAILGTLQNIRFNSVDQHDTLNKIEGK